MICPAPPLFDTEFKLAQKLARKISNRNSVGEQLNLQLAGKIKFLWPVGHRIKTTFTDNVDSYITNRVIKYFRAWEEYANVSFEFGVPREDSEVRIGFKPGGSWAYVGTSALAIPKDRDTCNFGWLFLNTLEVEYRRVCTHEAGHILGLVHEHKANKLPIDPEKAYKWYKDKMGWDKARVDNNVINVEPPESLNQSQYDPFSIMHYQIPQEIMLDGHGGTPFNTDLSDTDKKFIAKLYPETDKKIKFTKLTCNKANGKQKMSLLSTYDYLFHRFINPGQTLDLDAPTVSISGLDSLMLTFFSRSGDGADKLIASVGINLDQGNGITVSSSDVSYSLTYEIV